MLKVNDKKSSGVIARALEQHNFKTNGGFDWEWEYTSVPLGQELCEFAENIYIDYIGINIMNKGLSIECIEIITDENGRRKVKKYPSQKLHNLIQDLIDNEILINAKYMICRNEPYPVYFGGFIEVDDRLARENKLGKFHHNISTLTPKYTTDKNYAMYFKRENIPLYFKRYNFSLMCSDLKVIEVNDLSFKEGD